MLRESVETGEEAIQTVVLVDEGQRESGGCGRVREGEGNMMDNGE